jgi:hypothetical protein
LNTYCFYCLKGTDERVDGACDACGPYIANLLLHYSRMQRERGSYLVDVAQRHAEARKARAVLP